MRTGAVVVAVLIGLVAGAISQAEDGEPAKTGKLSVAGISVVAPDPDDTWGRSLIPMFPPGVRLHFTFSDKGRTILGLKTEAFKLESLTDDKGTDLAAGDVAKPGSWPELSEDRHRITFSLETEKLPAAGAREIRVKAKFVVLAGADLKTESRKDVKLEAGTEVSVGAFKASIQNVSEDTVDDKPARSVEFTSETGFSAVQAVAFLDGEGKPIESSEYGSSTGSDGDKTVYGKTWLIVGEPKTVTIEVSWFDKVEELVLPADFAVGVGL
jgi:hypothetical protein